VRLTSPSRRAAGLLAVTTIGLSTAVLSVTGTASADFSEDYTFTTASSGAQMTGAKGLEISSEFCSISWDILGASGGKDSDGHTGETGGRLTGTTALELAAGETATFHLFPGESGLDADAEKSPLANDGVAGAGGQSGNDQDGAEGLKYQVGNPAASWYYGGGGGAGSSVAMEMELPPASDGVAAGAGYVTFATAFGGDGAGADQGAGDGYGDEENSYGGAGFVPDVDGPAVDPGAGVISGTVHLCSTDDETVVDDDDSSDDGDQSTSIVTGAPQLNWVDGVKNGLDFQLYRTQLAKDDPITGVEYRLGDGDWVKIATENQGDYQYSGTITGLETGKTYSVAFRFSTAKGHTDASKTVTESTAVPGPGAVTAVAGASSIKVNWTAPADMNGVAGYVAIAAPDGDQSSGREVSCQPVDALGTSCVLPAIPGLAYGVSVHSLDATGNPIGRSDWVVTEPVSAPAISTTLPKADGTLTSDAKDGKAVAGEKITVTGKDFLPGSTVELVAYSTPVKLGSVVVLADGTFTAEVTLPKDMANGVHHLVASGVDVNGNARTLVVEVTVSGGTAVLAYTGFSPMPFVGAGALALLAGGGLLVASRRRAS